MRARLAIFICIIAVSLGLLIWRFESARRASKPIASAAGSRPAANSSASSGAGPTKIYAHNLLLRKGPNFRVYVRWLRGEMERTRRDVNPSFDDPNSFVLDIQAGVLRANMGDIGNFLNAGLVKSPLTDIKLSGDGDQIKLSGTLHKIVPLPVEMTGVIAAVPDNRIQLHVIKLNVLKVPLKAVLGGLHIDVSDLFRPQNMPGVQVKGNDIFFDTQKLLPPPHMRGQLTRVRVVNPDLEEVYGNAKDEVTRVEQWRNFLRLRDGTIDFGRLTMHPVDLIMIDLSNDAWFDLDLAHYQDQLVNGYTRMTPQAGLQIFMPDLDQIPHNKTNQNIGIQWMKNRNLPPPPDVTSK
ncbi:MAG TPA: hypothetical protein VN737_20685 [Bryobacteraceae bacterium]|jgi:hypothetical protein|nr:hypothetical protein [Bryobacteraceae bacterium]